MDIQSTGASDSDMEMHGGDQDRRGIDVAGRHLISDAPVFGNAGESSPTGTTDTHPERLRTPELPPSGLAPQGARPEGSVDPGSKSVAAPPSPEAGDGQVRRGGDRHNSSPETLCLRKTSSTVLSRFTDIVFFLAQSMTLVISNSTGVGEFWGESNEASSAYLRRQFSVGLSRGLRSCANIINKVGPNPIREPCTIDRLMNGRVDRLRKSLVAWVRSVRKEMIQCIIKSGTCSLNS